MTARWTLALAFACSACNIADFLAEPEPACMRDGFWYPDIDGNGVPDNGDIYVGCEPPKGWVEVTDVADYPTTTDTDVVDDSDTDAPPDTAPPQDTPEPDTGVADSDTAPRDSGSSDTAAQPTDSDADTAPAIDTTDSAPPSLVDTGRP